MAALAERRIIPHEELKARAEEKSEAQAEANAETRPEHLRLLEALLFAAAVPLDEKTLGGAAARGRRPQGERSRALQAEYLAARRQPGEDRQQVDLPHRGRPVVAAHQGSHRPEEAVARRDRDARGDRLPPAGDPRRGRGNPRRGDVEGHLRRADGDRLDQAARPPQGAGPPDHLRHHARTSCRTSAWSSWAICRAWRS